MKRCKCGCQQFAAHQIVRMDVVVDPNNDWIRNLTNDSTCIYDAEEPYGPYTCIKCGAVYDSLDALPDDDTYSMSEEKSKKLYVFLKFYEKIEGIKGVTYYEDAPTGLLVESTTKKDEIDSELYNTGLRGAFSVKELRSSDGTLWYYELLKDLDTYVTYEDTGNPEYPAGHVYSAEEMKDLYRKKVDKTEYPDYDCWISDMLKSGVFVKN